MPRTLPKRCQPDSIREFRAAARVRYYDAMALAAAGRRTAAVYVWGYTAEMILKAAYFSFVGHPHSAAITWPGHLGPAIIKGRAMGIAWPHRGAGHNVRAWAEFLIATRAGNPGTAYPAAFALDVQRQGQRVGRMWTETLRYHKNTAYRYEVAQLREAAEWFLVNSSAL